MTTDRKIALRYLIVGAANTAFGTGLYWLLVWLFMPLGKFGYMLAAVVGNIINVTESYLTYKLLVFRTKGNWLAEYVKCWGVYGFAALLNILLLPVCVEAIRWLTPERWKGYSPYVGGLVLTGFTVIISFLGHKNITFKRKAAPCA